MKTIYEWDIETLDKHGDIQDHYHHDTLFALLATLKRWKPTEGERYEVVLVRDVGDDCEGLVDRQWWYAFEDSPESYCTPIPADTFSGGTPVTKKHLAEFARYEAEVQGLLRYLEKGGGIKREVS
tara:strand:- start:76 stop:450 length:375 start_codon:yes stop_codon:yes gene_type:complete